MLIGSQVPQRMTSVQESGQQAGIADAVRALCFDGRVIRILHDLLTTSHERACGLGHSSESLKVPCSDPPWVDQTGVPGGQSLTSGRSGPSSVGGLGRPERISSISRGGAPHPGTVFGQLQLLVVSS